MSPTALLLSLVLAAPPPAMHKLPPPPSVAGAMLLDEGDPTSAAGVFERLWNSKHDPSALAWAGLARERAADAAHAVAYLTQALDLDLPTPLAVAARTALTRARADTQLVTVELRLYGTGPVLLALTRVGSSNPTLHFPLSPNPGEQWMPVALDPGRWLVELRRGAHTVARTVEVHPDLRIISLAEPTPPQPPPPRTRPLRLAGLITGGNLTLIGTVMLVIGDLNMRPTVGALSPPTICSSIAACRGSLAAYGALRAAGAGLLGAGLGIGAGAFATYFSRPRTRRIAWTVDLALGGALIASSFIGGLAGAEFNRVNQAEATGNALISPITRHSAGAAVLGLGLGLATSAALGLVLDRSDARRRARLRAHITPTGLALVGQF
jgi:hypothetical protein